MHKLLVTRILPFVPSSKPDPQPMKMGKDESPVQATEPEKDRQVEGTTTEDRADVISSRATLLVASHLLNPLVFSISTRGSSESVLSLFVLATLYFAYSSRWDAAAIFLGLSTHWKIYPFVYGVACLGVIGTEQGGGRGSNWLARLVSWRGIRFACLSGATFVLLGAAMYTM